MRHRKIAYYEDVDRGDVIVRKRPYVFQAEFISINSPVWKKEHPDGSYMRELYLGQGNNCLFSITQEEAQKRLAEWGVEWSNTEVEIDDAQYKEIVTLVMMGHRIVKLLPQGDGYTFSKAALDLCMKWIQMEDIDLGDLYDCLDSPEEIDFTYYEDATEDEKQKKIYRSLFHIIAYITKRISEVQGVNQPQYLDYIGEDFFDRIVGEMSEEYADVLKERVN